jgi:hypothetical protein
MGKGSKTPPAAKRTEAERAEDLLTLTRLLLRGGYSFKEMADALNKPRDASKHISPQQVYLDIQKIRKEWLQARVFNFNEVMNKQLDRIDDLEAQAQESFRLSMQPKQTRVQRGKNAGAPVLDDAGKVQFDKSGLVVREKAEQTYVMSETGQCGDSKFLTIIMDCIKERSKIFNLYSEYSSDEFERLIREEWQKVLRLRSALQNSERNVTPPIANKPGHNSFDIEAKFLPAAGE